LEPWPMAYLMPDDSSLSYHWHFAGISLNIQSICLFIVMNCLFRLWLVLPFGVETRFSVTASLVLTAFAQLNPVTYESCNFPVGTFTCSTVSCTLFLCFVTSWCCIPFPQNLNASLSHATCYCTPSHYVRFPNLVYSKIHFGLTMWLLCCPI
jgi:hypothetical protein